VCGNVPPPIHALRSLIVRHEGYRNTTLVLGLIGNGFEVFLSLGTFFFSFFFFFFLRFDFKFRKEIRRLVSRVEISKN
jgi:hypothetical protein